MKEERNIDGEQCNRNMVKQWNNDGGKVEQRNSYGGTVKQRWSTSGKMMVKQ